MGETYGHHNADPTMHLGGKVKHTFQISNFSWMLIEGKRTVSISIQVIWKKFLLNIFYIELTLMRLIKVSMKFKMANSTRAANTVIKQMIMKMSRAVGYPTYKDNIWNVYIKYWHFHNTGEYIQAWMSWLILVSFSPRENILAWKVLCWLSSA